jgi:threonine/homoserine/homoserine lactone efflux protein
VVHLSTLLTFAAVVLGLFVIPGPAVLMVLGRAAGAGRSVGIATGLGIAAGDLGHALMATFGLSALLMTSAMAFQAIKYLGAAYLIYLGVRAFFEKSGALAVPNARQVSASRAFRQAILTELLNPKTALFFLAFLPQFVHRDHGSVMLQLATLGLIFALMSAAFTSLIALGAGAIRNLIERHPAVGRWQGKAIGTLYVTLGARLALQER